MQLRLYTDADLDLTRRLEGDPEVMRHLGGPQPDSEILKAHERRSNPVEGGDGWFVIEEGPDAERVGTIGAWPITREGEDGHEVGWMVVPEAQGQGIATRALALLLEQLRNDPAFSQVHAYPGADNPASNALCKRAGFDLLGEESGEYRGSTFSVNHWILSV